nr:helicase protein MOM1-like isoform X1 [Tanacetum cinerariifolium]
MVHSLLQSTDEFHNASGVNTCSEECLMDELLEEFVNLITHVRMNKDATKLMITTVQPVCEIYGKNPTEPNKTGGEQPHTFWRKLLVGRNPCWKYLAMSNPRQRKSKRPQYIEQPPEKITNDDVSRKRKKTTNNITESVASKPVTEEGEVVGANKSQSSAGDSFWSDATTTSFHDLLKLKIYKLCEALGLSCRGRFHSLLNTTTVSTDDNFMLGRQARYPRKKTNRPISLLLKLFRAACFFEGTIPTPSIRS